MTKHELRVAVNDGCCCGRVVVVVVVVVCV